MEVLRKILFNEVNIKKCELVYCAWCTKFVSKSKFKLIDDLSQSECEDTRNPDDLKKSNIIKENEFANLTCTQCSRYLIRENQIQNIEESSNETSSPINNKKNNSMFSTAYETNLNGENVSSMSLGKIT